jgi:hypothetical protein
MKLIGALTGVAAWKISPEEYIPSSGFLFLETAALIQHAYSLQSFPVSAPGQPIGPIMSFQSGKFEEGDNTFAINQIQFEPYCLAVAAANTDQAERALFHISNLLDKRLGYRIETSEKKIAFTSTVIVEFDDGFEEYINKLSLMRDSIIAQHPNRSDLEFKRIAFGSMAGVTSAIPASAMETGVPVFDTFSTIEANEFVIERRIGVAASANRFFCTAPLSTSSHIRVLEEIEAIARS